VKQINNEPKKTLVKLY